MGYTHYWNSKEFSDAQWEKLAAGARSVLAAASAAGIRLAAEYDEPGSLPVVDVVNGCIQFNGVGEEGHETFILEREPAQAFQFCKTACKPYDAAVVAMLILASECGPLTWSSDGEEEDWSAGRKLLAAAREPAEPKVFMNDIELTALQAEAVRAVYRRPIDGDKPSFEEFVRGLQPMVCGAGAVILPWCNMYLAIEADGHVHS